MRRFDRTACGLGQLSGDLASMTGLTFFVRLPQIVLAVLSFWLVFVSPAWAPRPEPRSSRASPMAFVHNQSYRLETGTDGDTYLQSSRVMDFAACFLILFTLLSHCRGRRGIESRGGPSGTIPGWTPWSARANRPG
jgi:hypothetical protein